MYKSQYTYESNLAAQRKTLTILAICLGVVLIVVAACVWFFGAHVVVDGQLYSRTEDLLDLRGQDIAPEHYNALKEKMPEQLIYWDVPFQSGYYANTSTELTVTRISDEDMRLLSYFPGLKTVHAEDCEDYGQLKKLQEFRPDLEVLYTVTIDGKEYAKDAESLTVAHLTDAEVDMADYLPMLKKVDGTACTDYAQLAALQERHPECEVAYSIVFGDKEYALDTESLNLKNQNITELLDRLAYLPKMKTVHLTDPIGDAQTMEAIRTTYPNVTLTSELVGVKVSEDGKEVDLSEIKLEKIEDVEKYMPFYPDAEQVYLGMPEIDNETIAAFRESKRQDYKVVWTVMCGTIPTRTDAIFFQPIQHYVYYFFDEDAYNLRYCEDMICVDVGHMALRDVSWVKGMPNLKYLVLTMTTVTDLSPLSSCKNLIWLEFAHTSIRDYSPLLECTALQDLEIGKTRGNFEVLAQMTWLKNLFGAGIGYSELTMLQEALPETNINTTGYGWRDLPNYFAHRDVLGMPYMKG